MLEQAPAGYPGGKMGRITDLIIWTLLALTVGLVMLGLLLPYYTSGGCFPSTPQGTFPDRPDEMACIARFVGTPWEQPLWRDAFWYTSYLGCLLPLIVPFYASYAVHTIKSRHISRFASTLAITFLVVLSVVLGLWGYAEFTTLLWEAID
jgi:ABC-type Fe3+ transport system permease subunit